MSLSFLGAGETHSDKQIELHRDRMWRRDEDRELVNREW
jgi:hypothetical protein